MLMLLLHAQARGRNSVLKICPDALRSRLPCPTLQRTELSRSTRQKFRTRRASRICARKPGGLEPVRLTSMMGVHCQGLLSHVWYPESAKA